MPVITDRISLQTEGFGSVTDITGQVTRKLLASGLRSGIVTVFVPGSTAAITTIEFESGVISDFQNALERAAPRNIAYQHDDCWGDGNGFSHVRAAWTGPSLTVPFIERQMMLGTWQQLVLVDYDNRSRQRTVIVQMMGE